MLRLSHRIALVPVLTVLGANTSQAQTVASAAACAPSSDAAVVCTESGAVRGVSDGNTLAFKGIPYAKPPVGSLRWRPPEEGARWEGVRNTTEFGPVCPQLDGEQVVGNEDCLTLNVWRPRTVPATPLPVMVGLTGGGNHSSSGSSFNGEAIAERGDVVYVSYNLRLGVLGFLAHPALDAERPERVSGNYGSLDQIAMLEWLRRNISAFGGDPDRIFLFGSSAGGANICALMTAPLARGLFHGASMQSSVPTGCELQTLADAERGTGAAVVKAVGCDRSSSIASCLRAKSVAEIVAAVPGTFGVLARVYGPNVDGHVFPDQPLTSIAAGRHSAMPVIVGTTTDETTSWANTAGRVTDLPSYMAAIDSVFGAESREAILGQYPLSAYPSPSRAFVRLTTDALFTCRNRRVAETLAAAQSPPVYRYLFGYARPNSPNGAGHSAEVPFLYGGRGGDQPVEDVAIQRLMMDYWSRMARAANPNGEGAPQWSPHRTGSDSYLEIGETTQTKAGPSTAKCDFWDAVQLPWPHL